MEDARVVITGAGSGIGKAAALRCAAEGAEIICVDIDRGSAEATAAACVSKGASASAYPCDVADSASVQALAAMVERERGSVDVLVNNAGVGLCGPFLAASVEDFDWLVGVNLHGVAYCCHAFGARMVGRHQGHVVNIASAAAYVMSRDLAAYCASKAAVLALSRCLRADWAGAGVGVSAICPGVIDTPIASRSRMVGELAKRPERTAGALRFGHSPDLVARAIVRAVEHDEETVPVGFESQLAYRLSPLVPGRLQELIRRTPLHRVIA